MNKFALAMMLGLLALPVSAAEQQSVIEATTVGGEKVLLHPNGRWEFVDAQKQTEAKKVADQYPENKVVRPAGRAACSASAAAYRRATRISTRGHAGPEGYGQLFSRNTLRSFRATSSRHYDPIALTPSARRRG